MGECVHNAIAHTYHLEHPNSHAGLKMNDQVTTVQLRNLVEQSSTVRVGHRLKTWKEGCAPNAIRPDCKPVACGSHFNTRQLDCLANAIARHT
jgi:hypothetical protein